VKLPRGKGNGAIDATYIGSNRVVRHTVYLRCTRVPVGLGVLIGHESLGLMATDVHHERTRRLVVTPGFRKKKIRFAPRALHEEGASLLVSVNRRLSSVPTDDSVKG